MGGLALFISLGGVGYAATGGNFILGNPNTATSQTSLSAPIAGKALQVTNTSTGAGATALGLNVAAGKTPFTVNSGTKVANLNADKLDGLDSTGFLRNLVPLSLTGANGTSVIQATNTGIGNGVQGKTGALGASGVYGENTAGGFGLAGRSNLPGGVALFGEATGGGASHALVANATGTGGAIEASNFGSGPAIALHGASPMTVDSDARITNLNADKVDGASFVSNRIVSTTQFDHILDVPGFGAFYVDGCDHTNIRFGWNSGGPNAYVTQADILNPGDSASLFQGVANVFVSLTRPRLFRVVQLARDTGSSTSIATVTLTAHATDCVFAAHAVVQPS
jgi:hypothetical protein